MPHTPPTPTEPKSDPQDLSSENLADSRAVAAQEADSALDAAIEANLGQDDDDEDYDDPVADSAEAADPGDEDEEDPEDPEEDEEEEEDDEASMEADEDLEDEEDEADPDEDELFEAMLAIKAAYPKIKASVLKRTPKNELIAWGQEVMEENEASGSPDPSASKQTEKESPSKPARDGLGDWETYSGALAEKLGIDAEAVEAFRPLFDAAAQVPELKERTEKSESDARVAQGQATINDQMRRLERKFPKLRDNEKAGQEVIDEALTQIAGLERRGKEVDLNKAFERAARQVSARLPRSDIKQLRRNGGSTPPTTRPKGRTSGFETEDDYFAQALSLADRGQSHRIADLKPPKDMRAGRGRRRR